MDGFFACFYKSASADTILTPLYTSRSNAPRLLATNIDLEPQLLNLIGSHRYYEPSYRWQRGLRSLQVVQQTSGSVE